MWPLHLLLNLHPRSPVFFLPCAVVFTANKIAYFAADGLIRKAICCFVVAELEDL